MKKLFVIIFAAILFLFPSKTFAEEIRSFDTTITAHQDGTMDVVEKIRYDFEYSSRHGIFRYIPTFTKVGDLYRISKFSNIHVFRDGKKENFQNNSDAKQMSLKIGNADRTITGPHDYEIDYQVQNGIGSNYSDHDEIYWNGTGNGWDTDIDQASITFNTDFGATPTKIACYTGSLGSTDSNCDATGNSVVTNDKLFSEEGLSGVIAYPVGTFPKSFLSKNPPQTLSERIGNFLATNFKYIWLFLNIVVPILLFFWFEKHKNHDDFGRPSVNFDIPKDNKERIAPAEAGMIDGGYLKRDDITATIFDLAIRKYLKIIGTKKVRALAPDKTDIQIQKLKEGDGLNKFESTLFDRLFEDGDSVNVSDLKSDFYETFNLVDDQVLDSLKQRGIFRSKFSVMKPLSAVGGFIALFTGNLILALALFILAKKINKRTIKGDKVYSQIEGLKIFLKTRIRNYDWQAQKFYTVEQMIPYAIALGYMDEFMAQLKIIKPDYNPSWYYGYGGFYNNYALFSSGISSNLTTSAPSSSSGFSSGGGGFSGGGGGGGGGGSW